MIARLGSVANSLATIIADVLGKSPLNNDRRIFEQIFWNTNVGVD